MSGASFGFSIIKNLTNLGEFTEIKQDNQNIDFNKSNSDFFSGHLGVVKQTEVKKFGIGLNFI